ncbi:hypothetical protein [Lentilitoribacter sp. Alg239-R112]|uniref:hypothetical protein n=1 Tax=Lentilitoribacter sp. Alg239-R112 TaxID=2305987 RepID=UPI0013A70BB4|nr:hypothetical protein [Lentilitoribacter sp. Alg239-R112]
MNIRLRDTLRLLFITMVFVPSTVMASDVSLEDQAYKHYRCSALVELNRMTDADRIVCDQLKTDGFDLTVWEFDNREQSIKLQEDVFAEFF